MTGPSPFHILNHFSLQSLNLHQFFNPYPAVRNCDVIYGLPFSSALVSYLRYTTTQQKVKLLLLLLPIWTSKIQLYQHAISIADPYHLKKLIRFKQQFSQFFQRSNYNLVLQYAMCILARIFLTEHKQKIKMECTQLQIDLNDMIFFLFFLIQNENGEILLILQDEYVIQL